MKLFDVYPLFNVNIVKGKGCKVWSDKGQESGATPDVIVQQEHLVRRSLENQKNELSQSKRCAKAQRQRPKNSKPTP